MKDKRRPVHSCCSGTACIVLERNLHLFLTSSLVADCALQCTVIDVEKILNALSGGIYYEE